MEREKERDMQRYRSCGGKYSVVDNRSRNVLAKTIEQVESSNKATNKWLEDIIFTF